MEKFEDLYDDKKLREYSNDIRKFIYNILNDLRDRESNARLSENLFVREIELFNNGLILRLILRKFVQIFLKKKKKG